MKITLELTPQQLDVVIQGLHQLPHGVVRVTFDDIAKQIEAFNARQSRDSIPTLEG